MGASSRSAPRTRAISSSSAFNAGISGAEPTARTLCRRAPSSVAPGGLAEISPWRPDTQPARQRPAAD